MNLAGPNYDPVPITCWFYMQQMYCTKCSGFIKKKKKQNAYWFLLNIFNYQLKQVNSWQLKKTNLPIFSFLCGFFVFVLDGNQTICVILTHAMWNQHKQKNQS